MRHTDKLLANLGDVNFLSYGGFLVFSGEPDGSPYGEKIFPNEFVDNGGDLEDSRSQWTVYRFDLDRMAVVTVEDETAENPTVTQYLVPASIAAMHQAGERLPSHISGYVEWFVKDFPAIESFLGVDSGTMAESLTAENPVTRAVAYQGIGDYHGYQNLDSDPLTLTYREALERWQGLLGPVDTPSPTEPAESPQSPTDKIFQYTETEVLRNEPAIAALYPEYRRVRTETEWIPASSALRWARERLASKDSPDFELDGEPFKYQGRWFKARTELDETPDYSHLGEFTSEWTDGQTYKRRNVGRYEFPFIRVEIDAEDERRAFRKLGYCRHDAWVKARKAFLDSVQRLEALGSGDWQYCGVLVSLCIGDGRDDSGTVDTASLWGIETDSGDYLKTTALELADELIANNPKTLRACRHCGEEFTEAELGDRGDCPECGMEMYSEPADLEEPESLSCAVKALLDSADHTGCTDDLTVVSRPALYAVAALGLKPTETAEPEPCEHCGLEARKLKYHGRGEQLLTRVNPEDGETDDIEWFFLTAIGTAPPDWCKSIVLTGNEDSPVRAVCYESAEPTVTEVPRAVIVLPWWNEPES